MKRSMRWSRPEFQILVAINIIMKFTNKMFIKNMRKQVTHLMYIEVNNNILRISRLFFKPRCKSKDILLEPW